MGASLAEAFGPARLVFEEVDEALEHRLSRLMFEGPEEELKLTENAQPALMAVSLAVVRVLQQEAGLSIGEKASFVAGHSLGEYSALASAGTLELADAARLLRRRGRAMQEAVPVGEGAMAALLGVDLDSAKTIVEEARSGANGSGDNGTICDLANDNGGQVVISGHKAAVERAVEVAQAQGVKRCVMLPVSAPFHCALMAPAAEVMGTALADTVLRPPEVPLIANVTAQAVENPETIRRLLVDQVTGMVRWRESVLAMKEAGVSELVELGAGKVLAGLTRRIDRELSATSVEAPDTVETLIASL